MRNCAKLFVVGMMLTGLVTTAGAGGMTLAKGVCKLSVFLGCWPAYGGSGSPIRPVPPSDPYWQPGIRPEYSACVTIPSVKDHCGEEGQQCTG
jgi:hypothetical protein